MSNQTSSRAASLGPAASLMLSGLLAYVANTQFHAGGPANDHHEIFHTYAENAIWTGVHLGQFLAMAAMLAGLLVLALSLGAKEGAGRWLAWSGAAAAIAALALYAVLQAVDGVALKQAVNAWANAPETEQTARFAAAEAIRWLEWGMRSYQDYVLGLALILIAAAALRSARIGGLIAGLMGLSGIASLVQGWVAGTEGFTPAQSIAIVAAWVLSAAWMSWLLITALRMDERGPAGGSAHARAAA
jgi:hypothetical protein